MVASCWRCRTGATRTSDTCPKRMGLNTRPFKHTCFLPPILH